MENSNFETFCFGMLLTAISICGFTLLAGALYLIYLAGWELWVCIGLCILGGLVSLFMDKLC